MTEVLEKIVAGAKPLPETLATREVVRKNASASRQTYRVPFENIIVRKNFNVRLNFGDIETLANSMLENGQKTPLEGDMDTDGKVYLVDGERRYLAFKWLRDKGNDIGDVEFFINNSKTKEDERIFAIFTTNDNKKLEPVEVGLVFKRLVSMGWSEIDISKKIGRSIYYVQDHLKIGNTDKEIQDAITGGSISSTSVLKAQKKKLSQDEIKSVINESKKAGKSVKNKDIDKAVAKKKARDLFENPVQYDEIEKVILQWSGWAYTGTKKDLNELYKDIRALFKN